MRSAPVSHLAPHEAAHYAALASDIAAQGRSAPAPHLPDCERLRLAFERAKRPSGLGLAVLAVKMVLGVVGLAAACALLGLASLV